MKLFILVVLLLNFLGAQSHFSIRMHCNNWFCTTWNHIFANSDDIWGEELKPLPKGDKCRCVPYYKCHQDDISSQWECLNGYNDVDPDLVCCRKPVRFTTPRPHYHKITTSRPNPRDPLTTTQGPLKIANKVATINPASQPITTKIPPTTEDQSLTSTQSKLPITNPPTQVQQLNSTPNVNCTCIPFYDCNDEETSSNLTGLVNDRVNNKGSCSNPNDICCLGWVKPLTLGSSLPPHSPGSTAMPTEDETFGSSPRPQSPSPTQASPSGDKNCTCIPFYKCYDEETSSNLTNVVDDRLFSPIATGVEDDQVFTTTTEESCLDPNDICCYNLVKFTAKPTIDSSSKDCAGSCISIEDCPYLLGKLDIAKGGNGDAIQELRSSVCSRTNDGLNVCCPQEVEVPDCSDPCVPIKECPNLSNTLKEAQGGNSEAIQKLRKSVCSYTNGIPHVCCPANGSPLCQFPFIYKGVTYSDCTSIDDPEGKLWCSIQTDSKSNHVNDKWRHCTPNEALRE